MQNDKYLKFILTVIAICLVTICLRDIGFIKPASAQLIGGSKDDDELGAVQKVMIVGSKDDLPVVINDVRFGIMNELPTKAK